MFFLDSEEKNIVLDSMMKQNSTQSNQKRILLKKI